MTTRNILSEASLILARAKFTTLDGVTITVYLNAGGTAETLDSNTCAEQDGSGIFLWSFSDLTTAPTSYSDYLWIMTNGTPAEDQWGVERFGGFVNNIASIAGANTATITVEDTSNDPIADVEVQLLNAAQDLVLDTKTTNASGVVVFSVDDGSYKVIMTKAQVSFTVPENLTVSSTTTQTYTGTLLTITGGAGAGACEVSIFASSQNPGVILPTLTGKASIVNLPAELTGIFYEGAKINGTYDAANNRIFWILPQSSTVLFVVSDLGISAEKAIPATSTADYKDL